MKELSLNVMDVAQNSISAGANLVEIEVSEKIDENQLFIGIYDNGKGMSEEKLAQVTDPFFTTRTTRKIGLGVPLFKMAAEMTGGKFEITSTLNIGTKVKAWFCTDHLDFMPLGDITNTIVLLSVMNEEIDFVFTFNNTEKNFVFDTRSIKELLQGVPMNTPDIVNWLTEYINGNIL